LLIRQNLFCYDQAIRSKKTTRRLLIMIIIVPYDPTWPAEFGAVARPLRAALGSLALRIDHVGSTAVPGLAAKDKIDIQVTVQDFTNITRINAAITNLGYQL